MASLRVDKAKLLGQGFPTQTSVPTPGLLTLEGQPVMIDTMPEAFTVGIGFGGDV